MKDALSCVENNKTSNIVEYEKESGVPVTSDGCNHIKLKQSLLIHQAIGDNGKKMTLRAKFARKNSFCDF